MCTESIKDLRYVLPALRAASTSAVASTCTRASPRRTPPLTMAFFGLKCEPKKWTPFVPPLIDPAERLAFSNFSSDVGSS